MEDAQRLKYRTRQAQNKGEWKEKTFYIIQYLRMDMGEFNRVLHGVWHYLDPGS